MISLVLLAFVIGAVLGSMFLEEISRFRKEEPKTMPKGTTCNNCKIQLSFARRLPLIRHFLKQEKGNSCKLHSRRETLLAEIMSGFLCAGAVLAVLLDWEFSINISQQNPLTIFILISYLIIFYLAALYDTYYLRVPVSIILALIIASILYAPEPLNGAMWKEKAIGGSLGALITGLQYTISNGKGIGSGDILVALSIGIILGWQLLIATLFIGYLLGCGVATLLIVTNKANLKGRIALVPFLLFGLLTTLLAGKPLLEWYQSLF